jgi:Rrf2 family protein
MSVIAILLSMKLSQGVEWGIHCVALLTLAPPGKSVSREGLAGHYALPENYLGKHLQALTRAGLLHAVTGPRGGYRLNRPPSQITILDVIEAIEGTSPAFICQEIRQRGTGALPPDLCAKPCMISDVMDRAEQAWRDSLRQTTIADIVAGMSPRSRELKESLLARTVNP